MNQSTPATDNPRSVQVLDRTHQILELLAAHNTPMTLNEIARALGLHPSTIHRLLWNLHASGFLERDKASRWHLGLRFMVMGNLVRNRLPIRTCALPIMQVLHEKTDLSVYLSIPYDNRMIFVEHISSPSADKDISRLVGSTVPLHCTSCGKLYLSECDPAFVSGYIAQHQLTGYTEKTITTPERLILALDRIRELQWAESAEELDCNIHTLAGAVRNSTGSIVAAISLVASTAIPHKIDAIRHLLSAARTISASLSSG